MTSTSHLASSPVVVTAQNDRLNFPTRTWSLDPTLTFLNHGSYGSSPRSVLEAQAEYRARMERDPVRFFKVDLERLLDTTRERIGQFVNCRAADIAPMPNATVALRTVIWNANLGPGDEVLITDHEYMSIVNELERYCQATGAKIVQAKVPFPIQSAQQVTDAVMACVTPRTKLAILAHITSATSLIFPMDQIVPALMERGIEVCVDGAHTPGQVPVDVRGLAPTYYVGSFHKWLCAPKGTGFLYVRADKQKGYRPWALSSRAHKVRPERALYLRDFDYVGTDDYTGFLCVPHAIDALQNLLPGGMAELMRRNHELALVARDIVCKALNVEAPAPDDMHGSMASIPLPEPSAEMLARTTEYDDPLQDQLIKNHRIVAPIWRLSADNRRIVRVSAQVYNSPEQYERLGQALVKELALEHPKRAIA
jgi:isopenicillin-N epimerase